MINMLQNSPQSQQSVTKQPVAVSVLTGNGGIGIGVNNAPITTNNFYGGGNVQQALLFERNRSSQYCNIFVVKDETFDSGCFSIPKSSVPSVYLSDPQVPNYPSLFMDTNGGHIYRSCDYNKQFYYGYITQVTPIGKNIRFYFQRLSTTPMFKQQLNLIAPKIGINNVVGVDLLDKTGWTVLEIDLLKQLDNYGIDYT